MGGCAGKNKSNSNKKDDHEQSPQENLPVSNDSTVKNITEPNTQDQYDGIHNAISQIFSSRVISISNSELEYELANLIYGHPEHDYAENPPVATTFKSTEV